MVAKFGGFARGAAAAKTLFTPSSNTQMPGFFVSTPQFNRQKSQVGFYIGDAHRQSYSLDSGSLPVGPSYAFSTSSAANNDDDDKDIQRTYPSLQFSRRVSIDAGEQLSEQPAVVADAAEPELVEMTEEDREIAEIKLLVSQGRHEEVLEYIDALENAEKPIPTEAYNMVLASLVEISLKVMDISPVLEAYKRIITSATPEPETYTIVLSGLLRMAKALEMRREHMRMLIGPENTPIESIRDIYEAVAVTDHLKIAVSILEAVDIETHDQELYDNIVLMCLEYGLDVSNLLSRCQMQAPRIAGSATYDQAAAVFNTETASTADLNAMIDVSFRFGNADAAIALDSAQTAQHLTMKLAEYGYVSTAWQRAQTKQLSFAQECSLLVNICNHNVLSTATLMFNKVVASKKSRAGAWCGGRSAYLRLCARLGEEEMLFKAIRESQIRFAIWDPTTLLEVSTYLLAKYPQAAVELFVVHTRRLNTLWKNNDLQSFSGQELIDAFLAKLEEPGPISIFCALIMSQSPFVVQSATARQKIFQLVWDARINAAPEFVEFISEVPETLVDIVGTQSDFILANESHVGLALPFDTQNSLHKVYPLFVSDIMTNNLPFSKEEARKIAHCLDLLKIKSDPWRQHCETQEFLTNQSSEQDEVAIKLYANTTNGIDTAIDLFERQLLLLKVPKAATLRRIVDELISAKDNQRYNALRLNILNRVSAFDKSTTIAYYKTFVTAASLDPKAAKESAEALHELSAIPCAKGFVALIRVSNPNDGMALFYEAIANNLKTSELYDAMLQSLAQAQMVSDVERIISRMGDNIKPSNETFRVVLDSYLAADREVSALDLMKLMFSLDSGYERTTEPYDKLLEYYVFEKQDRKAALKIIAYMKRAGVVLSPKSYKLLIDTWLLKPMALKKADLVLETMHLDQAVPDTKHFSSLLRARGILGRDLEGAQAFYRGLVKNSRVFPDQHIFAALMMSYIANGKSSETPKVLDEMAKYNISPEIVNEEIQRMT